MEHEYKWNITEETIAALAEYLHAFPGRLSQGTLEMAAVYYDTPGNLVRQSGMALRLRKESSRSVVCMKRTVKKEGAEAVREEYEAEAESLQEGLAKLPAAGAPRALCAALAGQSFREIARTEFTRTRYMLACPEGALFTAEFAIDIGRLGCGENMESFEEAEFEIKSGDDESFRQFAAKMEQQFHLKPQPLSKMARAAALGKG